MSIDLTFLTNETGKKLKDRLDVLLKDNTKLFDCLVGYFYVTGFFKICDSLTKTEKIRILVGISTNKQTYDLLQTAKQSEFNLSSHSETKKLLPAAILAEMENSKDSSEIEQGVLKFIEWLKTGKLEVRAYPSEKIHAKLYIMTFAEDDRDKGRVVTGSSNLTQAGLQHNLEFNVELKNSSDHEFALTQFNNLWKHSVDVSEVYVDTIQKKSPYAQFSPYELYLKFLYEYFRGELNRPEELEDLYLPTGFKKLKYQEEAVLSAKRVLDEYGGVFISDVVGLGKTYMSAMLARELSGRSLVIAPPALLDKTNPGSWPNVFSDFRAPQTDFESIGKLDDLLKRNTSKYSNIFIDESHRFRTETNQTYEKLAQICRGKRIILVSATPLNNKPKDILSQIKLFQPGKNSSIPNVKDLESFFGKMEKRLKGLDRKKDREKYFSAVRQNASETRDKVLKYLMIRRTRGEIEKYYGTDMKEQKLKFPDVCDPDPLFYRFGPVENEVFNQTIRNVVSELTFARYKPFLYYEGSLTDFEKQGQVNLAKFMMILLVKRLESSFHAFRLTLDRFIRSHEHVIEQYKKGHVFLSKKHISKIFEYLEAGDEDAIQALIDADKADRLAANDFRSDFIKDLEHDLKLLRETREQWKRIKRDPKWVEFHEALTRQDELKKEKLIIFTESKETAEYLLEKISSQVDSGVIYFSGHSNEATRERIISNFDARAYNPKDDYRILVTTDVLAEGVNLHRSRIVINYDIPWNPTRMMQRVGRVNRIDSPFDSIHTYNFFPSDEGDDAIKLKEAAEAKIEAFIEMLGADARLLTDGEEIKSHEIFGRLNSKKTLTGEDENEESELEFLSEIREVRDKHPDLFERIKRLPKKARSTRKSNDVFTVPDLPALLTYFRQGRLDKFFVTAEKQKGAGEIDFMAAAKILRPEDKKEKRLAVSPEFYDFLNRNKQAFMIATSEEQLEKTPAKGRSNEAYLLKRLKANEIRRCKTYTEDDEEFIRQATRLLDEGSMPKQTAKIIAQSIKTEVDPLKVLAHLRKNVPLEFLRSGHIGKDVSSDNLREVILSSLLLGNGGNE